MPCDSRHMEPTAKEKHRRKCAKLWLYAVTALSFTVSLRDTAEASKMAEQSYPTSDKFVEKLCSLMGSLPEHQREHLLYGNPKNRTARELADWWEDHQKTDEQKAKAVPEYVNMQVDIRVFGVKDEEEAKQKLYELLEADGFAVLHIRLYPRPYPRRKESQS